MALLASVSCSQDAQVIRFDSAEGTVGADGVEMVAAQGAAAQYWPGWRGPGRQGVVQEGSYPDRWSTEDNVVWNVEVPGEGNSSPIIWENRVFLTTAYENGRRRSILCFDRDDGQLLWERFAPEAQPERAHGKNSHATPTPATDGQRVYAYLGNHGLFCVDFDGQPVWHVPMQIETLHGVGGSPLLYRDRIILYQEDGRSDRSFIAAFDRETGDELWRTVRDTRVGWGTPIAIRAGDRDEIIVSSQHEVNAYDPATGQLLWRCEGNTVEVTPTPVVGHGLVFCSSGRAGPTLAIRPGGDGDVTDSHLVWKAVRGSPFVCSPVLWEDNLYIINDLLGVVACYKAQTGETVWQGRLEGEFSASPIAHDGKIFFTNEEGKTYVLKAGDEFQVLHTNDLQETTLASPALVDGRWYIRTATQLYCIGTES